MTVPINTKHQIIEFNGQPVAAVVPYKEYLNLMYPELREPLVPHAVVKAVHLEGKGRIQAWREYLGLTQEEAARRIGIKQASYQQMEKKTARPRKATLEKVAAGFGINLELLRP